MAFGGGVIAPRATCKAITGSGVGVRGTACARKMSWHLQLDERGTGRCQALPRLGRRHACGAACWQGQNTWLGWFGRHGPWRGMHLSVEPQSTEHGRLSCGELEESSPVGGRVLFSQSRGSEGGG
jgi:hypothetical protein